MNNKLDINYIYKIACIVISFLFLNSCSKENESVIIDDLVMSECFELDKQFNLVKKEFFQQIEDPVNMDYVSQEMNILYDNTTVLRKKAVFCTLDLYDNYDEGQAAQKSRERMVGITSDLGKYEAVIFTHLKKIDQSNFERELRALKKMLEEK